MRVISINTNGIRSATKKGFIDWMKRQKADVVCVQETKAQVEQLGEEILAPKGYNSYFFDAQKKGYSGVAIYSKQEPDQVIKGGGWPDIDNEGRLIRADFGNLSVLSLYMPSGSAKEERQEYKYGVMDTLYAYMEELIQDGRDYIICGDWNIAHKEIDLKNYKSNRKNSGFLPEECAWLDKVFDDQGWVDAFRVVNQEAEQYTWWSNRGQAWAKNVGWRIDYHIVSPSLKDKIESASIYKRKRFSDHAPLILDYNYELTTSGNNS